LLRSLDFETLALRFIALILFFAAKLPILAQEANHPDRLEWFRDQGFGLFIHWGVDSQLGSVISQSLRVGSQTQVSVVVEPAIK
jgi:Alpha-L-fucosidase